MKKIVMIHTSPVSLNDLKELVKEKMPEVELVNIIDDSLLEEVKGNGGLTPAIISRMMTYVQTAASLKPDLIFNQCSSVGEAFDIAKKCTDIPTLKIDEAMAEKAVSLGKKIAVIATVASTMKPSCNLVRTKAKEAGKEVEVKEYLVNGALDILMKEKNVEKHNQLVLNEINKACEECDVVVLAQGSMTAILPYLKETSKPVLTSPEMAIDRAKEMLYGK
ncbi:aspartate/glutamate racemase family protein [uncultured Traorella sp.]|uniref:aspartate/glutamate racemase family protein n=1 Tax=uncultured Traorella sp. TaxID=1929048 RepID=UPI0025D95506|nr:aspartate/glutamate racemase family protein [uncultured Traorella sp.]